MSSHWAELERLYCCARSKNQGAPPCRPFPVPFQGATIARLGAVGFLADEELPGVAAAEAVAAEIFAAFPAGSSYLELCFAASVVVFVGRLSLVYSRPGGS